jgi:hypothetical protein
LSYALNVSSVDHCRPCDDTGYVELKGTITVHGIETSRGMAPCKWCEQGKARYIRLQELRQDPATRFDLEDVEIADPPGDAYQPGRHQHTVPKLGRMPSVYESEQTIEARKAAAAKAAREASRPEDEGSPSADPTPLSPPGRESEPDVTPKEAPRQEAGSGVLGGAPPILSTRSSEPAEAPTPDELPY